MFEINRYLYVDKYTKNKFEIYARTVELADNLIERINKLGVFNLRRAKINFIKHCSTEKPPYEVEQEQIATVEQWEKKNKYKV